MTNRPHSRLGIASCLLFFGPAIGFLWMVLVMTSADERLMSSIWSGIVFLLFVGGAPLTGIGLGIAAICSRRKSRKFGVLGVSLNVLAIGLMVLQGFVAHEPETAALMQLSEHMMEYRYEHGKWPDSLDDVPDQRLISFRGTNFIYDTTNCTISWPGEGKERESLLYRLTDGEYGTCHGSLRSIPLEANYEWWLKNKENR
jgi:hypothetical protein